MDTRPVFRVAIVGGRNFNNFQWLCQECRKLLCLKAEQGYRIIINNGGAKGADALGGQFARVEGYECKMHPANWDAHGKRAGYLRNESMSNDSDAVIAFWDGESRGTKHMIDYSKARGIPVRVIRYQ